MGGQYLHSGFLHILLELCRSSSVERAATLIVIGSLDTCVSHLCQFVEYVGVFLVGITVLVHSVKNAADGIKLYAHLFLCMSLCRNCGACRERKQQCEQQRYIKSCSHNRIVFLK